MNVLKRPQHPPISYSSNSHYNLYPSNDHKTSLSDKAPQATTQQILLFHTIPSLKDKMAIPVISYPQF